MMNTLTKLHRLPRLAAAGVIASTSLAATVAFTTAAQPAQAGCGANDSVSDVSVKADSSGPTVSITPTKTPDLTTKGDMTNDAWHAAQACVGGLTGTVADSVYQQIKCHADLIAYGGAFAKYVAGPTWDAELWRSYSEDYVGVLAAGCATGGGPVWSRANFS